jgi:hypothetical protein
VRVEHRNAARTAGNWDHSSIDVARPSSSHSESSS